MKKLLIAILINIVLCLVAYCYGKAHCDCEPYSVVDSVVVHDTIRDTLYITNEKVISIPTLIKDTVYNDSTVQSIYSDSDSIFSYTAFVEGKLDSLKYSYCIPTITNTVEVTKFVEISPKKSPIEIKPVLGVGYGLIHQKFDAFMGVGLVINL